MGQCQGFLSAGRSAGAGVTSMMGTQDTQGGSDLSGATLRVLLANPPKESSDDSATPDVAEIPDPEAETYMLMSGPPSASLIWKWKQPLMSGLPLVSLSWW